jgi:hypothetical protein
VKSFPAFEVPGQEEADGLSLIRGKVSSVDTSTSPAIKLRFDAIQVDFGIGGVKPTQLCCEQRLVTVLFHAVMSLPPTDAVVELIKEAVAEEPSRPVKNVFAWAKLLVSRSFPLTT